MVPLVDAIRDDSVLRPSEFGWLAQSSWGTLPARRAPIGGGRIARRVVGQLKRPPGGVLGALRQGTGFVVGVVLALVGIPAVVFSLVWLASVSILLLPAILIAWVTGVFLLLRRALTPARTQSSYRSAMVGLADLSYCPRCDAILETETGRVVPNERLHERLFALEGVGLRAE